MKLTSGTEVTAAHWTPENPVYLPAWPLPCCMTPGHRAVVGLRYSDGNADVIRSASFVKPLKNWNHNTEIPVIVGAGVEGAEEQDQQLCAAASKAHTKA